MMIHKYIEIIIFIHFLLLYLFFLGYRNFLDFQKNKLLKIDQQRERLGKKLCWHVLIGK